MKAGGCSDIIGRDGELPPGSSDAARGFDHFAAGQDFVIFLFWD